MTYFALWTVLNLVEWWQFGQVQEQTILGKVQAPSNVSDITHVMLLLEGTYLYSNSKTNTS